MLKSHSLSKIAIFFRLIEICILLVLISRFSCHLPVAVKNSGKYLWDITVVLLSPRFVFVIGNAIVITLFVKSGWFSGQDSPGTSSENDLYKEFVMKSQSNQLSNIKSHMTHSSSKGNSVDENDHRPGMIKRSRSEKLDRERKHRESPQLVLRRSATDKCVGTVSFAKESVEYYCPEDNMSNEEFRSMVEAFIARQQRLIMEEEYSV